jgi:hypothetical protein
VYVCASALDEQNHTRVYVAIIERQFIGQRRVECLAGNVVVGELIVNNAFAACIPVAA